MTNLYDLFTDQDYHAFADGELAGERLTAFTAYLAENPVRCAHAASIIAQNMALSTLKKDIYARNPDLAAKIQAVTLGGLTKAKAAKAF